MNYVKKIKTLGFKKIEPTVVCSFRDEKIDGKYLYGHKLRPLSEILKEKEKSPYKNDFDYPRITSQYVSKINTYLLKISESVSVYLILVGNEYTLVISDNTVADIVESWSIHSEKIKIPIKSEQLSDVFWKKCLSVMDKGIQREILLRNFLK